MTEMLYLDNSYLKEFDATIISVEGNTVILDKTAFYPGGGGLVPDKGKLVKVPENKEFLLVAVKKSDGSVLHELSETSGLKKGDFVRGIIDWDHRYKIMRMHTAVHLLANVVNKNTGALTTGNQISTDKSRIDFNVENFDKEKMLFYVEEVNRIIEKDLSVKVYYLPRDEAFRIEGIVKLANAMPPDVDILRIVDIGGFDIQADGGVHVKTTKEIGKIEVVSFESRGKNNKRVYFKVLPE